MTNRWSKLGTRLGRIVGYQTKTARAEQLAASEERARTQPNVTEETGRAGRRYLRP